MWVGFEVDRDTDEIYNRGYMTSDFKLWTMGFLFLLIFSQILFIFAYPEEIIIPTDTVLSIALVMIGYLWFQELQDRYKLQIFNNTLRKVQEDLKEAQIDTITTLVLTEEAKDPYVQGHSGRVAHYSMLMAREMGLSEKRQKIIETSSILHDIGKIGISDDILNKASKLDEDEWKMIKQHPQKAVEILSPLKFLEAEKNIIMHHHERYDGAGYPDGLKAEKIPLEARIMAVADTFDAMNSARPYRAPLAREEIRSELKRVAGLQLDYSVVTIFLDMLDKNPELWEKE